MLWKEGATVVALRPTATIEFKVHLRPHLLAANLVYDIPVEIMYPSIRISSSQSDGEPDIIACIS
jgi:hypothetical protein